MIHCRMKWIADLEIYNIARTLEKEIRHIYEKLNFDLKRIMWGQFIRSMDSVWANIAEWFGRFHYLDSIKFYYNARWSLYESKHRLEIFRERKVISEDIYSKLTKQFDSLFIKLNNFIRKTKEISKK